MSDPVSFNLWHRSNGSRWRVIASAATEAAAWQIAYAKMEAGEQGDWQVLPAGAKPQRVRY